MEFYILMMLIIIHSSLQVDNKCLDKYDDCNSVDYASYKICVRRREKRSVDCDTHCTGDCDCESCNYSNCKGSCNSCCNSCCSNYMPCGTNDCCHKTCRDQCRSSDCRRKCDRNCIETIKMNEERNNTIIAENDNKVNVTTVIHLNNVINTTNIIDIPIQVNNNVTNSISAEHNGNHSGETNCCIVISPKQCVPTSESPYSRCFHYRARQCGDFCIANIVHKEQREVCQSAYPGAMPNCHPKIIYIPQPQPKCRYESTWPFVSCGIKKSTSCAGCYANEHTKTYMTCPPDCYDTGFGTDPYYRRGPVYRRTHLGDNGFEAYGYGNYGGFDRYPPYGAPNGRFFPPVQNEFHFESLSPDGLGHANYSFEPGVSFGPENENFDRINVGTDFYNGYDTLRNMRETAVEEKHKPSPAVPAE